MKIHTILPFHPSIAEQIQKGEKQGSITLAHGQEPWRLIHIIGEDLVNDAFLTFLDNLLRKGLTFPDIYEEIILYLINPKQH